MKPLFDAMFYRDQPSLIRRGLRPIYFADNGVLNRATEPEATGVDNFDTANFNASEFAFRRIARDAIGVEPGIHQNQWKLPADYDAVEQPVCIDLEAAPLPDAVYSDDVVSAPRQHAYAHLGDMVLRAKREASYYGKTLVVGAYHPLLPQANNADAKAAAEFDARPFLDRLDFAAPEGYVHDARPANWWLGVNAALARCVRLLPGRPVYPVVTPCYMDRAPEALRYKPLPLWQWKEMMLALLSHPKVAGLIFWGGVKFGTPDFQRLPFQDADPYVTAAAEAARR